MFPEESEVIQGLPLSDQAHPLSGPIWFQLCWALVDQFLHTFESPPLQLSAASTSILMAGKSDMDFNKFMWQGLCSSPSVKLYEHSTPPTNIDPIVMQQDNIIHANNASQSSLIMTSSDFKDAGANEDREDSYGSIMTLVQIIATSKKLKDTSYQKLAIFATMVFLLAFDLNVHLY